MSELNASAEPICHADLRAWFAAVGAHQHAYAVIDLANLQDEAAKALKCIQAARGHSILQDARQQAALASPWLVHLSPDEVGRQMFSRTLAWAIRAACVTWLESPLPLADLAQRLHERTKAELPDAHAVLLRFFDPRVLPQLHSVLDVGQVTTFWALGNTWRYLGRNQQVHCIALTDAPTMDAFAQPLTLSKAQFDALLSASEIDTVMPELAREAPEAFLALPPDQRAAFTRRCLKLADTWHVEAFAQRVMVGVLVLKLGEGFDQQAEWVPWIAQLSQRKIDLIQAIEGATTP